MLELAKAEASAVELFDDCTWDVDYGPFGLAYGSAANGSADLANLSTSPLESFNYFSMSAGIGDERAASTICC